MSEFRRLPPVSPTDWYSDDRPPASDSDRLIGAAIMASLLIGILAIWLAYDYKLDRAFSPELPCFQIHSASVSGLSATELITWWNITLLTTNPNRNMGVDYRYILPSIYYGDRKDYFNSPGWFKNNQIVATKKLSRSFFLDKGGNQTSLVNFNLVAVLSEDVDYELAEQISEELALRGSVKLGLYIRLEFGYRTEENYLHFRGPMQCSFFCNQVEFVFAPTNNGTGIFTGHSRECTLA
ncbi:hypothetical protein RchiOBHm_Chr3g0471581 [Rosa chinensis]|uniref:Late embryogenesis abundant protein LEA-2 subgroup domain-containing protein n=1 Tax=Rosa chinensis TaxID=74649 RepID=A0A2P6RBC0_ROSCH|nr:uncharacterized protein LOC121052394 [Rosa chinensis]XP_040373214.1 uncharacterized protein LOC121052394 [Rosa chinensis]PRQ43732.1 hypothetical protein RchiOBHm_Chr3g0471581 [Rosa chinensis]